MDPHHSVFEEPHVLGLVGRTEDHRAAREVERYTGSPEFVCERRLDPLDPSRTADMPMIQSSVPRSSRVHKGTQSGRNASPRSLAILRVSGTIGRARHRGLRTKGRRAGLISLFKRGKQRSRTRGPRCGIIAIGGPPLEGKALLCARLAEITPGCVRLEAIDDLRESRPFWLPEGRSGVRIPNPTGALLARSADLWNESADGRPPLFLIVSRFGTARERNRARTAAKLMGARFLFVEARSRNQRALRRIPVHLLSRAEEDARWRRYEQALARYQPVTASEAARLPAVRLARVLANLDHAVQRILRAWRAG